MGTFCLVLILGGIVLAGLHLMVSVVFDEMASITFDDTKKMKARFLYIRRAYVQHDGTWIDPRTGNEAGHELRDRAKRLLSLRAKS